MPRHARSTVTAGTDIDVGSPVDAGIGVPDPVAEVVQVADMETNLDVLIRSGAKINLKKMPVEKRGELIHAISQGLLSEATVKDMAWLKLGFLWKFVISNKLYRYAGDHIRNANDFLRELDLGIKRREMDTYAQMAGLFGRALRARGQEIPIRKLVLIAPLCKRGDVDDWIEKAYALPTTGLEDAVREAKGQTPRDACVHPDDRQEVWTRCGCCGKWLQRVESES